MKRIVSLVIGPLLVSACLYGETAPLGTIVDNRVRTLVFNENDVYKIVAYYGYQVDIQLAANEEIKTIAAGDTVGWQIIAAGQHLFIKPMAPHARTDVSVVTSRRTYVFDLVARPVSDPLEMTYLVRFQYPQANIFVGSRGGVMSINAAAFNFRYKVRGAKHLRPSRVFDDGTFTFFQFDDERAQDLPAIFWIGADGQESLVNYRMDGHYMVVERVGEKFVLRSGKEEAAVTNQLRERKDNVISVAN